MDETRHIKEGAVASMKVNGENRGIVAYGETGWGGQPLGVGYAFSPLPVGDSP